MITKSDILQAKFSRAPTPVAGLLGLKKKGGRSESRALLPYRPASPSKRLVLPMPCAFFSPPKGKSAKGKASFQVQDQTKPEAEVTAVRPGVAPER